MDPLSQARANGRNGRNIVDHQLPVQHCWELLRSFARVAKTLTGVNLCVTIPSNTHQQRTGRLNRRDM